MQHDPNYADLSNLAVKLLIPLHSLATFSGFLIGSFGLACIVAIGAAYWSARYHAWDDAVLPPYRVRPVFAIIALPVPLLLTIAGFGMLWRGVL